MSESDFVFEEGEAIDVGAPGEHDFVYHKGEPVPDTGESKLVFEAGTGLGDTSEFEDWENWPDDSSLYDGDTDEFWETTSNVNQGSQAGTTTTDNVAIWAGDKGPVESGTWYACDIYSEESNVEIGFAVSSDGYGYSIGINPYQDGEFEINDLDFNSVSYSLKASSTNVSDANTWYTVYMREGGGSIEASLYDGSTHVETLTADSLDYTPGGIGFKVGGLRSKAVFWDFYRQEDPP